jgi:hypothetical protein
LVVTAALVVRILVIDKPEVMIILISPIAGALVALWKPWRRWVIAMACVLTAATAVITLIGGVGLLYVPSIALYLWGFVRPSATVHTPALS